MYTFFKIMSILCIFIMILVGIFRLLVWIDDYDDVQDFFEFDNYKEVPKRAQDLKDLMQHKIDKKEHYSEHDTGFVVDSAKLGNTTVHLASSLPKIKAKYSKKKFVKKYCENCSFYGNNNNTCRNSEHYGDITQNTVEYCRKYKSFVKSN